MYAIFISEFHSRQRAPTRTTAAAAVLVPSDDLAQFDRCWRLELIKNNLPVNEPYGWQKLAAERDARNASALRNLHNAAARMSGLGYVVAISGETWNSLPTATRRSFGSADTLCFLQVMRIVIDKLEECGETSPVSLRMQRDPGTLRASFDAVERLIAADTRASGRISTFAFVDPARDSHFAAIDLVLHTGMQRLMEPGVDAGVDDGSIPQPFPDNFALELWDKELVDRRLQSIEWGQPAQPAGRKRRRPSMP